MSSSEPAASTGRSGLRLQRISSTRRRRTRRSTSGRDPRIGSRPISMSFQYHWRTYMQADLRSTSPVPLLTVSTAKAGGAERVLAYLVGRLPALGFEPTVPLLAPGPIEDWLGGNGRARGGGARS